eukprot:scaffold98695_cov57-Phaeocystis_antarctica.AAC.1
MVNGMHAQGHMDCHAPGTPCTGSRLPKQSVSLEGTEVAAWQQSGSTSQQDKSRTAACRADRCDLRSVHLAHESVASARLVQALTWAWTRKCEARLAVAAGIADIALRLTAKSLVGASGARDASSHARVGRDVAWLAGQRPQFATSAAVTTWAHRAVALTDEPCAVAVGAVVAHRHGRRALAAVSASGADLWHDCCLTA